MRLALSLARHGYGQTSPNPMVGAVLVRDGEIIGCGWHHRAGLPHAEIEALQDARKHGHNPRGATLYVTLEPCCTRGRTPPCTQAIIANGIKRVIAGADDPNPKHQGRGFEKLRRAGIKVDRWDWRARGAIPACQKMARECEGLNEAFNHWIVEGTPFVTVKAAMTLDGKIATANGESKWITGEKARARGMKLRHGHDAILVGVNTILADNPSLTARNRKKHSRHFRIVLDSLARIPLTAKVVSDGQPAETIIVVGKSAPKDRVAALAQKVKVVVAPVKASNLNLSWLLKKLGAENITSLLVEGGGEVNASFLLQRLAQRVAFFYAPKILGGRDSHKAVAGEGVRRLDDALQLREIEWRRVGPDLFLTARVD